ncbi:MAG: hypothetical protein HY866_09955, partial [Chloroflexi bacterium]|nr:hypothetical protein [Chloroflexota bacterium]
KFERLSFGAGLRVIAADDLYEQKIQLQMAAAVVLGGIALLQLRTVRLLSEYRQRSLRWSRLFSLILMSGFAISGVLWWMVSGSSDNAEDSGLVQQLMRDAAWLVRLVALLLLVQSGFALWYLIASFRRGMRLLCHVKDHRLWWRRVPQIALALGMTGMIAAGAALGVLTDWIYELPVPRPDPGDLLYATSFDDFNDEWDIFPGRDATRIVSGADDQPAAPLTGGQLEILYGSPATNAIIWSTLDRKFNDIDLRVTARLVDGPVDQNQFGVIFRYRDEANFYIFRISADGYYLLAKVENGLTEIVSEWNVSEAIHQGAAANEIRVLARRGEFRFFVNDQPVPLCLKGKNLTSMWDTSQGPGVCYEGGELTYLYKDSAFKQGRIALAAGTIDGSEITVAFDDLVIVGPDSAAMAAGIVE